jgi:hypothetical protein
MKRLALAVLAAAAVSSPALAANCDKDYKEFWERTGREAFAKQLTGQQLAQLNRYALRGYDACSSGDERFNAENFFRKLDAQGLSKAEDLFRQLDRDSKAKK